MKPKNALRSFLAVIGSSVIAISSAHAADGTWTADAAGNWSDIAKWNSGAGPIADGADFTALFDDVITANRIVTLNSSRSIGNVTAADTSHNYTIQSNTLTLDVTSGSPTISVASGRTLTISSVIAGNDGFTKTGGGTATLSGSNTLSGDVTVSAGVVNYGQSGSRTLNSLSGSGDFFRLGGDNTLSILDASAFTGNLRTFAGGNSSHTIEFKSLSDAVGAGNLQFGGGSGDSNQRTKMRLYGDVGPLTLDNRSIEILPKNPTPSNWSARGTRLENNNGTASNKWVINTDLINVTDRNHEFELLGSNTGDNEFFGAIGDSTATSFYQAPGALSLIKDGTGKWILSGTNTYTGGTTVTNGTLVANATATLSTGDVRVNGGTLVIGAVNAMSPAAALFLPSGTGHLTLDANQSVTALYINGVQQPVGVYTNAEPWITGTGTLTVGAGVSASTSYWDINDTTAGAGGATPTGTWDAANTFWNDADGTGTAIAWVAGRSPAFAAGTTATGTYAVTVDGTQDIGGITFQEGNVTLTGGTALRLKNDALALVNSGATGTIDTSISDDGTAWAFTKGNPGTLTLGGANTYTGATRINAGTLIAGSTTALGNGGDVTFGGGTLTFNSGGAAGDVSTPARFVDSTTAILINTNGEDVTLAGDIDSTNTGGLTKSGAGALTLGGTNSYNGNTTISGGSLVVSGTISGSGNTTISGGSLVVSGTISGSGTTTVSSGSLIVDGGTLANRPIFAANTSMSIINGGTVNSTGNAELGPNSVSNVSVSVVGGAGGTSTWNLGNSLLTLQGYNPPRSNKDLTIDGDGVAASAVVTNISTLQWGRTTFDCDLLVSNGGRLNVNSDVQIGSTYYGETGINNTITIQGGTANSIATVGQDFYIGYGDRAAPSSNTTTVGAGGQLTITRHMYIGHVANTANSDNPSTANQLTVTGGGTASMNQLSLGYAVANDRDATANVVEVVSGGQMSTTGLTYIGRANNSGTTSNGNSLTVSGTGSSWNAGNQTVYVGHTNNASAASNNNFLTVGTGGALTNVNNLIVGFGSGTETGNQLVVNGSLTATTLTVNNGNSLSGIGTITGPATFNTGATASFTVTSTGGGANTTPMTITGVMTYNDTEVHLNLPADLPNGDYILATSSATPVLAGSFPAPVVDSGSYGTGGSGVISLVGNDLVLTVSGVSGGTPYETWAATFLPDDVSDPALNFDSDSLTNLQEFAFGTDPTASTGGSITYAVGGEVSATGLPVAVNFADPGVDYRAVFGRRKDYMAAGLTYTVQFSADMFSWTTSGDTPTEVSNSTTGDIDAVSVPYPLFIDDGLGGFVKPTFFRVGVAQTP